MGDKDIDLLKHARPSGAGWEWARRESAYSWRKVDEKTGREVHITFGDGKWWAGVSDSDKQLAHRVEFQSKEAMLDWAREFACLKVRRTLQTGHKYYARPIETIKNKPGCWDSYKIGIFRRNPDGDELIGDYNRNYSFLDTFHWFTKDGKDYALYSRDYTATRIMELPSCKDLGGEEPDGAGFCPVEFYIPSYVDRAIVDKDPRFDGTKYRTYEPSEAEMKDRDGSKSLTGLLHEPFAFVAGCVWGDDTSWKIEYLDLSQADKGILKHDSRFGYIELPGGLILRDAIDLGDTGTRIRIAHDTYFERETGERFDYEMEHVKEILARGGLKVDGPKEEAITLKVSGKDYEELLEILKKVK